MPPLFQNTWPCVQLLCAERNAPCQRDLAIDKAKPPASAVKRQGNDQTDLQCQAARSNELLARLGIEEHQLLTVNFEMHSTTVSGGNYTE